MFKIQVFKVMNNREKHMFSVFHCSNVAFQALPCCSNISWWASCQWTSAVARAALSGGAAQLSCCRWHLFCLCATMTTALACFRFCFLLSSTEPCSHAWGCHGNQRTTELWQLLSGIWNWVGITEDSELLHTNKWGFHSEPFVWGL